MKRPTYVYDNWSTYDELSDAVPLTEELALFQLEQLQRLQSQGVKFDAYLMDAFWYEPSGEYREWRRDRWPHGPEQWLAACQVADLAPGLWFPANTAFTLEVPEAWKESLSSDGWGFCCFEGGFLSGFIDVLEHWFARGVRVFKFDFADFGAASDATKLKFLPSEIRAKNIFAYSSALKGFRVRHPDAKLLAYNGFEEAEFMTWTDRPVRRVIDPAWLEVFDTIYCGDPRPADVPQKNFWRTLDIYADHEIWYLHQGGLPLEKIDNCSLMLGKTGTCYWRGNSEWHTTVLLSYARRSDVHVTMGNLEALSNCDAQWIAQVQELFESNDSPKMFGGAPGKSEVYGYEVGKIKVLVNPSLESMELDEPGDLIYADQAHQGSCLSLSPGGVALIGDARSLGGSEVEISVRSIDADWSNEGKRAQITILAQPGEIHFGFRQVDAQGLAVRTSTGTTPLSDSLRLQAFTKKGEIAVTLTHDRAIWSGISWAYGVVKIEHESPIRLLVTALDPQVTQIIPFVFQAS